MNPVTYDQLRVLYRTLLVFATVGTVILAIGLVEFVYFERPGEASGVKAHIVGVFAYDPVTKQVNGPDRSEFPRSGQFAAPRRACASRPGATVPSPISWPLPMSSATYTSGAVA